jgi:hypothetical protein
MDGDSPHDVIHLGATLQGGGVEELYGPMRQAESLAAAIREVAQRLDPKLDAKPKKTRRKRLMGPLP